MAEIFEIAICIAVGVVISFAIFVVVLLPNQSILLSNEVVEFCESKGLVPSTGLNTRCYKLDHAGVVIKVYRVGTTLEGFVLLEILGGQYRG